MVNEDHGDDRHITLDDLQAAAAAAGLSVADVAQNIQDAVLTSGEEGAPAGMKAAGE
jgi:hypothetical protein